MCKEQFDLLCEAMAYQFRTLENRTGREIVKGTDSDKLALLALAGDETVGGLDQTYANILCCHSSLRMVVETARVRNTRPLR